MAFMNERGPAECTFNLMSLKALMQIFTLYNIHEEIKMKGFIIGIMGLQGNGMKSSITTEMVMQLYKKTTLLVAKICHILQIIILVSNCYFDGI